jgi:hypothetical protein
MSHPSLFVEDSNSIRSTPSVLILVIAILSLGFIPGAGVGIFFAESLSLGLFAYSAIIFLFLIRFLPSLIFIPRSICVAILILILYSVIQLVYLKEISVKPLVSAPAFFFICISSCLSAIAFSKMGNDVLSKAVLASFKTLILVAILNLIFPIYFLNYNHPPAMLPFMEPSQFAHFFGAIAIMTFVVQKTLALRLLIGTVVLGIALAIPSVTLMAYALLIFILSMKFRLANILFSLIFMSLSIYAVLTTPYFFDRLMISSSSDNLSALVYVQGISDVVYSLESTNYIGLGFQLLGTQPPSEVSDAIEAIAGGQLNREDGGFLAAKILSELGILGAIFIIYYLKIGLEAFIFVTKQISVSNFRPDLKPLLVAAIILAFSVELFLRGSGYFSPGVFLFIFALFYYKKYMKSSFSRAAHLVV